jgi:hypothetical protein
LGNSTDHYTGKNPAEGIDYEGVMVGMALIFVVVSQSTSTGEIKAEAEHGGLRVKARE